MTVVTEEAPRAMWIAPLLNSDWEDVKSIVQRIGIVTTKVDEANHLLYATLSHDNINALSHERRLCCGYANKFTSSEQPETGG